VIFKKDLLVLMEQVLSKTYYSRLLLAMQCLILLSHHITWNIYLKFMK